MRALLVALPIALAATWLLATSTARVSTLRASLAGAEAAGRGASAAVERLEPKAVEAELAAFDRRREIAADLARARRNRVLGAVGLVAAALAFAALAALERAASDVDNP